MTRPPLAPLLLGLAGLIPFIWGTLIWWGYPMPFTGAENGTDPLATQFRGRIVLTRYGTIILCFMSGVLWGFATRAKGAQAAAAYTLSVLPALWVFLNPGETVDAVMLNLIIGFLGVLMLDFAFFKWGLTPTWWMPLRVLLTVIVVLCLFLGS